LLTYLCGMLQRYPIFNYTIAPHTTDVLDVYIDGDITDTPQPDGIGTSFSSFRTQVLAAKPATLNVYINSGGGALTEAMAIHDFLLQCAQEGMRVNTKGRGIVASAATYILAAGNSDMSRNSWFMLHNVAGGIVGSLTDIEQYARTLRTFNNTVRDFYATQTGISTQDIEDMMNQETWLTAEQAYNMGFVNALAPEATFARPLAPTQWLYNNTAVLNAYNASAKTVKPTNRLEKLIDKITNAIRQTPDTHVRAIHESPLPSTNPLPHDEHIKQLVQQYTSHFATKADTITRAEFEAFISMLAHKLGRSANHSHFDKLNDRISSRGNDHYTPRTQHAGVSWGNMDDDI